MALNSWKKPPGDEEEGFGIKTRVFGPSQSGAGSRRTPGLRDKVLKPGEDSLPGKAAEESNLAEMHPLSTNEAFHRDRGSIHGQCRFGQGWLAAMMCDPSVEPW
jgi:hypothetical protein